MLADAGADRLVGFLSFVRLVGVVYMNKHGSGFSGTPPEAVLQPVCAPYTNYTAKSPKIVRKYLAVHLGSH